MRRTSHADDGRELRWDRTARWWPRGPDAEAHRDLNLWMLAEDAGLEIWSQYDSLDRWGHDVEDPVYLENCSDELLELIVDALPYSDHARDLPSAVRDFSKLLTQQLILFGRVHFDLQLGWDEKEVPPKLRAARLSYIDKDSVVRIASRVFQVVPPGAYGCPPQGEVRRLESSRLVVFEPPRKWQRPLAVIRRSLPAIGRSEHVWMQRSIQHGYQETFKAVHRSYVERMARLTGPLGWCNRAPFRYDLNDYYWMLRALRWRHFCIEIRDHILSGLGQAIARIARHSGEQPRLHWRGLPTLEQVSESERRLAAGGCRFDELLAALRPRIEAAAGQSREAP